VTASDADIRSEAPRDQGPVCWLMPVPTVALALPVVLVTVFPTVIVPLLLIVLDGLPDVAMPLVLEVIEPLLVMLTGFGPPAGTAVLDPPLIVPLLTSDPPFGRL
jgi:hypothetical protein